MKTLKLLALVPICFILSCTNMQQKKEDPVYLQSASFAEMGLPFCEVVRYGNTLYLSGQVGNIPGTANLVEGGIVPETRQTMLNIKQVLEANGSSLDQVIKCTCMLADIEDWAAMSEAYVEFFPNQKPARSAFATSGLAIGARVEIECIAYVND